MFFFSNWFKNVQPNKLLMISYSFNFEYHKEQFPFFYSLGNEENRNKKNINIYVTCMYNESFE